ncbi:MAG: DUF4173 domain-containing protein [Phycisphaeraceae bacterium]|nr:DUF4173 domain-containing protein [Phycisphaeraceae bacterium]
MLKLLTGAILLTMTPAAAISGLAVAGALCCSEARPWRAARRTFAFVFPFALLAACIGLVILGFHLDRYYPQLRFPSPFLIGAAAGAVMGLLLAGLTRLVMRRRRFVRFTTAALLLGGLIVFLWPLWPMLYWGTLHVLRGKLFSGPVVTGGALDQPSLQKGFFLFCYSSVIVGLCLLVVRWLVDRTQRRVRIAYRILACLLALLPLFLLTVTFCQLLRYIFMMGFTMARVEGVMFALIAYAVVFAFTAWTSSDGWPRGWQRSSRPGLCPQCDYDLRGTPGYCPECGWRSSEEQIVP